MAIGGSPDLVDVSAHLSLAGDLAHLFDAQPLDPYTLGQGAIEHQYDHRVTFSRLAPYGTHDWPRATARLHLVDLIDQALRATQHRQYGTRVVGHSLQQLD
ncbi:hypothetical protein IPC3_22035 [Pseudomonas aeruginosa]|nr:hypothetical protein IPC3_22035 [Pseudomonas aeruginosa]